MPYAIKQTQDNTDALSEQYAEMIVAIHGPHYPYILFKSIYGNTCKQELNEPTAAYVKRCAKYDFMMAGHDNAVYQGLANQIYNSVDSVEGECVATD